MTQTPLDTPRNFGGSLATIRLSHEGQPDGIAVVEHDLPQGYAPPLHVHLNQDEIFHILKGQLYLEVGGEGVHVGPGDITRAPKGVPHRFIVLSEGGAHLMVMTAGPDFENFVREASTPLPQGRGDLPRPPTQDEIDRQSFAALRNGLELLGPPLTMDEARLRAA